MILPTKHINFSESLLALGAAILESIDYDTATSIDELWRRISLLQQSERLPAKHTFDNVILAVVFLHSLDLVEEENGEVKRCT